MFFCLTKSLKQHERVIDAILIQERYTLKEGGHKKIEQLPKKNTYTGSITKKLRVATSCLLGDVGTIGRHLRSPTSQSYFLSASPWVSLSFNAGPSSHHSPWYLGLVHSHHPKQEHVAPDLSRVLKFWGQFWILRGQFWTSTLSIEPLDSWSFNFGPIAELCENRLLSPINSQFQIIIQIGWEIAKIWEAGARLLGSES